MESSQCYVQTGCGMYYEFIQETEYLTHCELCTLCQSVPFDKMDEFVYNISFPCNMRYMHTLSFLQYNNHQQVCTVCQQIDFRSLIPNVEREITRLYECQTAIAKCEHNIKTAMVALHFHHDHINGQSNRISELDCELQEDYGVTIPVLKETRDECEQLIHTLQKIAENTQEIEVLLQNQTALRITLENVEQNIISIAGNGIWLFRRNVVSLYTEEEHITIHADDADCCILEMFSALKLQCATTNVKYTKRSSSIFCTDFEFSVPTSLWTCFWRMFYLHMCQKFHNEISQCLDLISSLTAIIESYFTPPWFELLNHMYYFFDNKKQTYNDLLENFIAEYEQRL